MAKDPAFLFYPGDYLRDTQVLSEKSQVAYDRIMCEHMRNICITQQQLNFFTKRLSDSEKEEIIFILDKIDGGYQIRWVAESIVKRKKYSESRRKNRTKSTKNISITYDKHMENENENEDIDKNSSLKKKVDFQKLENTQWFESILKAIRLKITYEELLEYWKQFQYAMIADDDLYRDKNDYRSHFRNWTLKQIEKNAKNRTNNKGGFNSDTTRETIAEIENGFT